jgi:hypothetical protein
MQALIGPNELYWERIGGDVWARVKESIKVQSELKFEVPKVEESLCSGILTYT